MKKLFLLILALSALLVLPLGAYAQQAPAFSYVLEVDGVQDKQAETGDVVTVSLILKRTDSDEPYTMYAMQDEIRYDGQSFRFLEDSVVTAPGVVCKELALVDGDRKVYLNYLSFSGGEIWDAEKLVGTFKLKVTGTGGVSGIRNENILVSRQDGTGSLEVKASDAKVILSTACTIRFMTRGGSEMADVTAEYGELLPKIQTPTREGYRFVGWYRDIDLTKPFDPATDLVDGNMTLYAKWEQGTEAPAETAAFNRLFVVIPLAVLAALAWEYNRRFKKRYQ